VTGLHREYAMRLLRNGVAERGRRGQHRRQYGIAARNALVVIWEASDRTCGKRLRPLMPALVEAMERHGHLDPVVLEQLLSIRAATIDRTLRKVKAGLGRTAAALAHQRL